MPRQRHLTTQELLDTLRGTLKRWKIPTVTVQTGDCYDFDGFCVWVLRTPDEAITRNGINNSSCVYRVELPPAEWSRADYVQMAHHGQRGVSREVYEAVHPRVCLWCTPSWLWDNVGPNGYDTGHFQTMVVREWISSLGCVERHYRMSDGDQIIEL